MSSTSTILESCLLERRTRLQALVADREVAGLLVTDHSLLYWLGAPGARLLFVTGDAVTAIEASRLAEFMGGGSRATLGFDASLTASQLVSMQKIVPGARWRPLGDDLARLLAVKDAVELALLHQAARITHLAFERVGREIAEGRTELDLLQCATATLLEAGGQGFSFDPSIAGGPRSCQLWAGTTLRTLQLGEPVLIDMGISFRGYQCDMARTWIVGGRQAALKEAWAAALDAVEDAFPHIRAAMRPGVCCGDLYAMCERLLAHYGGLPHALGHGVGLGVHEYPMLAPGSTDILLPGMVIALEPAIIVEGEAGFRYEDVVVVTDDGCEVLLS